MADLTVSSAVIGYYREARQAAARVSVDFSQQAKGQARETVERLKKQMSDLSLVALVNPKAVARLIRGMARELGMAAKQFRDAGDPSVPASAEAAAATGAIPQPDPHADDHRFAEDVRRVHGVLRTMMEGAVSGAEKDDELATIVKAFNQSSEDIAKATDAIDGWGRDGVPPQPFIPGTGGVLV
jgi:hypothetical protein